MQIEEGNLSSKQSDKILTDFSLPPPLQTTYLRPPNSTYVYVQNNS